MFRKFAAALLASLLSSASFAITFQTLDLDSVGGQLLSFGDSVDVGDFRITNQGVPDVVIGQTFAADLANNGNWQPPSPVQTWTGSRPLMGSYVDALLGLGNSVRFSVLGGQTISRVGLYWMSFDDGASAGNLRIAAYNALGQLLESTGPALASTATPVNGRIFTALARETADISYFVVSGDTHVYNDITFSSPVPELEIFLLLGSGLAVVGFAARRKRKGPAV